MELSVNFNQAFNAIKTLGVTNTILLRGQPGIGKSALLPKLAQAMPDYDIVYVDVATLDLGDLGMPVIDKEDMVTEFAPSSRFGLRRSGSKPLIVMLDELGKAANKQVLNMLLPVILERRLNDVKLPDGSIVFATTNLDTDGVGDMIPAHAYNRMTVCTMRNPDPDEWLEWAGDNGVAPEIMAFVKRYPQVMQCYTDLSEHDKNPYIFNPLTGNTKCYASPRSLAKASNIVRNRHVLGDSYLSLLAGTVGNSAARDIDALVNLNDQLPAFEAIVKDPSKPKVPENVGALFVLAFMLVARIKTDEDLTACMQYMGRVKDEVSFEAYSLFIVSLATNSKKVGMACRNREFTAAAAEMGKYF